MSETDFNFETSLVLKHEGGYGWDPRDPGGPTNFGITCYDLAELEGQKMDSMAAWAPKVKGMTLAEAMQIYRNKYWAKMQCDNLPNGTEYPLYDYAINSGLARAIRVAEALCGLPQTGRAPMSNATVTAIANKDPKIFINAVCDERMAFLQRLPTWDTYRGGWTTRVSDVRNISLGIQSGAILKTPKVVVPPSTQKISAPKATHINKEKQKTVIKGAAAGSAASTSSFAGFEWWQAGLIVLGVVTVGGVAYYLVKRNQEQKQAQVILPATH